MTTRKKQTITEETVVGATDDSPSVIAYRVGQLEKTQAEGFARLDAKLDGITNGFATIAMLQEAQKTADIEHNEMRSDIKELKGWNTWAVRIIAGALITGAIGAFLTWGRNV